MFGRTRWVRARVYVWVRMRWVRVRERVWWRVWLGEVALGEGEGAWVVAGGGG